MKQTPSTISAYRQDLRAALNDEFLRDTLDRFSARFQGNRTASYQGLDMKAMIRKVSDIKDRTAQHVEEIYERFKAQAEQRGVVVHRAATATEANEIIARIAREHGVRRIVKSKSMTSEETQLNARLTKDGMEIAETDLGEWIVQLRHEGPSHMVAPAIHLSREQVADLFAATTGQTRTNDIEKQVKVSRRELRKAFIEADMGISGANFAVAETGAIVLVTNEGNARLVTTLPPLHVALCGLDKLVETVDDVMHCLRVLPRNSAGQPMTSYVDWIDGTNACPVAPEKRKIMHIVFLDNGRTAIMKDPLFSQIARCVRCGACSNVCPIYCMVGGHQMGHIYNGPIGLILTYFFHGRDKARAIVHNCVGCEKCKNICGGGIDLPRLIREIRARLNEEEGTPAHMSVLSAAMKNRRLFHSLLRAARLAQRPVTGGTPFIRHMPQMFMPGQEFRALPAIADKPFRDQFASIKPYVAQPTYRVAIFAGCAQDFVYPEQLTAAVRLLGAHGVAVDFPDAQTCCGLPLTMMGQREAAADVAVQNLRAFDPAGYDAIITLCASCASYLKKVYPEILENKPEEQLRVQAFSSKIIDFSSFVHDVLRLGPDAFDKSAEKVTYHASCHLCRGLGVTVAPRELLAGAAEYLPAKEEDMCCGFGGTYSMKFPELSAELLKRKLDNVEATGATRLVADCPGCIMQLRGGEEKRGNAVKISHIAELLYETMKK